MSFEAGTCGLLLNRIMDNSLENVLSRGLDAGPITNSSPFVVCCCFLSRGPFAWQSGKNLEGKEAVGGTERDMKGGGGEAVKEGLGGV